MDEVVSNIREAGWLRAIKLCSQSGLTTRAWCKENNVNERQYYYWQKKIRSQAASNLSLDLDPVTTFAEVPAPVSGSASNADLVVRRNGTVVEIRNGVDPSLLQIVLSDLNHAE